MNLGELFGKLEVWATRSLARPLFQDIILLCFLNLVFALRYLTSPSTQMPGFPFRMDGYSYALFSRVFIELSLQNVTPLGNVWVQQIAAGHPFFIVPDPLFISYSGIMLLTNDFILSFKIVLFLTYIAGALTSYYLATFLLKGRLARLVTATSFTFSQTTLYEVSLGHLSMSYGMALMPVIVAFLLKSYRTPRFELSVASGILLFFLIIEREDYGYMMIAFTILLLLYHLVGQRAIAKSVLLNTGAMLSTAFLFSFPYLQSAIFSKLSLWERSGTDYGAYSPRFLQLVAPIFSNVEAYIGDITLVLALVCALAIIRRSNKLPFRFENRLYLMISISAIIFVVIGLGASTPLYYVLYTYLPSFTGFKAVAGNPTYWLQPAKLCISILAGAGSTFLVSSLTETQRFGLRSLRIPIAFMLIALIVLDGGTFLAVSEPYSPIIGWAPSVTSVWNYNLYNLIQTSPVPRGGPIYKYLASEPNSFSVIEIPDLYTIPDYQYLTYLTRSNVEMLNPYGVPDIPSIFTDIYSSRIAVQATSGNASELASDLALIGVKYIIYEGSWGGPYFAQGLKAPTSPFQYLMNDGNVSLFRNLLFGQVQPAENLLLDPGFETRNNTIWQPWNVNDTYACEFACFVNGISRDGTSSLQETAPNGSIVAGRTETVDGSQLSQGKYLVSGWSNAMNVSSGSEFGLRIVESYQNGTQTTLAYAPFERGSHDWQYSEAIFNIDRTQQIESIAVTTYLRSGTGTAWIDDVNLNKIQPFENWDGVFAVRSVYGDSVSTVSGQNLVESSSSWSSTGPMQMQLNVSVTQPAFLILPISYDKGWSIRTITGTDVPLNQYKGLMQIQMQAGSYRLSLVYTAYKDSLYQASVVYISGLVFCIIMIDIQRVYFPKRKPTPTR